MNPNEAFTDLNIDAVTGERMMSMLGIGVHDLSIPSRFSKLKSIIGIFKNFSDDTQRFLISRATTGKNVDRLEYMYEYSNLLENKLGLEKELQDFQKETSALNTIDPIILESNARRSEQLSSSLNRVKDMMSVYEK